MKLLVLMVFLTLGLNVFASTPEEAASFNKVKNVYISHMQQKIIFMSEMTSCMAQGKNFKDLKACSKTGKAKIATLDKKAHEAHLKAKKKREKEKTE